MMRGDLLYRFQSDLYYHDHQELTTCNEDYVAKLCLCSTDPWALSLSKQQRVRDIAVVVVVVVVI